VFHTGNYTEIIPQTKKPPMINRELFYVARDRIELPTQGFSVIVSFIL